MAIKNNILNFLLFIYFEYLSTVFSSNNVLTSFIPNFLDKEKHIIDPVITPI